MYKADIHDYTHYAVHCWTLPSEQFRRTRMRPMHTIPHTGLHIVRPALYIAHCTTPAVHCTTNLLLATLLDGLSVRYALHY